MNDSQSRRQSSSNGWQDHEPFPSMPSNHTMPRSQMQGTVAPQNRKGYNTNGQAALPVPQNGSQYYRTERNGSGGGRAPLFNVARSPPGASNKNTKHVPCKFFRQGTCQAGNACPFSHILDTETQQPPCKYFMKGNCKFGAKCALAHILPDGRVVKRSELDYGMNVPGRPFPMNNRANPPAYQNMDPALNESMLNQAPYMPDYYPMQGQYPFVDADENELYPDRYMQYRQQPNYELGLNSPPRSQFGSPPEESHFAKSPVENLRTALDAPLPQSFDSNGISHIAKYGPLGQSVPDKFGLRSPPSSSLTRKISPAETLPPPRTSALASNIRNASPLGLSPQYANDSIEQRMLHPPSKPRVISMSVPKTSARHEWEDQLGHESELLPGSLHDEVLTPQERLRRHSRPEQEREMSNGLAIPSGTSSGSPQAAGSPSRFSAIWEEQRQRKATETSANPFGHVGSPLRETWMPNDVSQAQGGPMSGLSQAMARIHVSQHEPVDTSGHRPQPGLRQFSAATMSRLDRTISSPGFGSKRVEEDVDGMFVMDNDDGKSPRLTPLRERPTGEPLRDSKPMYGLRP